MTAINWTKTFYSEELDTRLPTYGNYGGRGYSGGDFGESPLTSGNPRSPYLTPTQLLSDNDKTNDPVDPLDYLFYRHDVASLLAGDNPVRQGQADFALLTGVVALRPETFDPSGEASLYAGLTTLAMVEELAANNQLSLVSPVLLFTALQDAVKDIQYGLTHLSDVELATAASVLFERDPAHEGVFFFDFTVTTNSAIQELYESFAMNALNVALDSGEQGNERWLDTSGHVSNYNLTFDVHHRDLDLHSGDYLITA